MSRGLVVASVTLAGPMSSPITAVEGRILDDPDDEVAWDAHAASLLEQGDPRGERLALATMATTEEERAWLASGLSAGMPMGARLDECVWRHRCVVAARVHIAGRGDVWRLVQLMADAHARLLGSLTLVIDAGVRSRALAPLVGAKFWQLRALRAGYHARGNRVVRVLVEQPQLHLRTLDLRHAGLTDEGMLALAGCEQLRGLRALYLQHNRFTARGAEALLRSPALAGLAVLDLRHNSIGAAGAAALAASPHLGGLTALYLYAGELERDGVRALARSTTLPGDLVRYWRAVEAAK